MRRGGGSGAEAVEPGGESDDVAGGVGARVATGVEGVGHLAGDGVELRESGETLGGEGVVTPPGRREKKGIVEALEGEGARDEGIVGVAAVEAGEGEAEVDAAFVGDELGGGAEVAFGADGIGDEQVPAEIEVGDFLVGVLREGGFEEAGGFVGFGGIGGEIESVAVEQGSGVVAAEARDEDEREEGKSGEVELRFACEGTSGGRCCERSEGGGEEREGGDIELEIEKGKDEVASERDGGEGAGRERFAARGASADEFAKKKGDEGQSAKKAGGAGFGPELDGGAVKLEDVFDAAVELSAVSGKDERSGAGAPAEQRAVGAHEETGVRHGGALTVALGESDRGGVGVEKQGAGAGVREGGGDQKNGADGAGGKKLFARQAGVEDGDSDKGGDCDETGAAAAGEQHECAEGGGEEPGKARAAMGRGEGEPEKKREGEAGEAGGVVGVAERVGVARVEAGEQRGGVGGIEKIEQPTRDAECGSQGEKLGEAEEEGSGAIGGVGLEGVVEEKERGEGSERNETDEKAGAAVEAEDGGEKENGRKRGGGEGPRAAGECERGGAAGASGQREDRRRGCGPKKQLPRRRIGACRAGIDDGQQENAGDGDEAQQSDDARGGDKGGVAHAFGG